jgi:hypothetical protein
VKVRIQKLVLTAALLSQVPSTVYEPSPQFPPAAQADLPGLPEEFISLDPIDAHVHAFRSDPSFFAFLQQLHLHVLDILVVDSYNIFRAERLERDSAIAFVLGSKGQAKLSTTFDPFSFETPGYAQRVIAQLDRDFDRGAIAVKIWKNVGMQIQKSDGTYLMPDDPVFTPIYQEISRRKKTLIAHLAEPTSCWQPPNPSSPDYDYYQKNPEWYMYLYPGRPSKEQILAARDRMLAENPHLRVVGAHLGSMETSVDEMARHLDQYPNLALDMAARMEYLMLAPRETVRHFLIKYQDRILYATDLEFLVDEPVSRAEQDWKQTYARDWNFLATDDPIELDGRAVRGLALPRPVLKKIYHSNAETWIPGIVSNTR